jgi:hypothetical protein
MAVQALGESVVRAFLNGKGAYKVDPCLVQVEA